MSLPSLLLLALVLSDEFPPVSLFVIRYSRIRQIEHRNGEIGNATNRLHASPCFVKRTVYAVDLVVCVRVRVWVRARGDPPSDYPSLLNDPIRECALILDWRVTRARRLSPLSHSFTRSLSPFLPVFFIRLSIRNTIEKTNEKQYARTQWASYEITSYTKDFAVVENVTLTIHDLPPGVVSNVERLGVFLSLFFFILNHNGSVRVERSVRQPKVNIASLLLLPLSTGVNERKTGKYAG